MDGPSRFGRMKLPRQEPVHRQVTGSREEAERATRRGFLLASVAAIGAAATACGRGSDPARLPPRPEIARAVWNPQKTWAFFVGVLSFTDSSFGSFPTEGRVDAEVVAALKDRGVPDAQIVFLVDEEATQEKIETELVAHLRRAAPGDMLILYYAGHGHREADGSTYFIPYDVEGGAIPKTGWGVRSIFAAIEKHFRDSTALLTADCCYSGRLAVEAAEHEGDVTFATLASAVEREVSTDAWTFSECLRDALRGRPRLDGDRDSVITLDELGRWVQDEMPFKDGQLASFSLGARFPRELVLTQRVAARKARIGDRVEIDDDGEWRPATIEDAKNGKLLVHRIGFGTEAEEWVVPARLRPWAPTQLATGASIEVLDEGQWYAATVLDAKLGVHFVHYEGWPESDDEWVGPDKVRLPGATSGPFAVTPGQTERIRAPR
jgi:hypothetical protein